MTSIIKVLVALVLMLAVACAQYDDLGELGMPFVKKGRPQGPMRFGKRRGPSGPMRFGKRSGAAPVDALFPEPWMLAAEPDTY